MQDLLVSKTSCKHACNCNSFKNQYSDTYVQYNFYVYLSMLIIKTSAILPHINLENACELHIN